MAEKRNEVEPIDLLIMTMNTVLRAIQEEKWEIADVQLDRAYKLAVISIASDFRIFLNKKERKS